MIKYVKSSGGLVPAPSEDTAEVFLAILGADELRESKADFPHREEFLRTMRSIRYCKAEVFRDCIFGTLRIPQRSESYSPRLAFGYYMTENNLLIAEETGDLKKWAEKETDAVGSADSPDRLLLYVLEQATEDDILYLSHFENELEEMEESLSRRIPKDFFAVLTKRRKKISEFGAYYEQLIGIAELMQTGISDAFVQSGEMWEHFARRVELLLNHTHLLNEYLMQLRELYQSEQGARQNRTMEILTVVTTIFLPLTLLTGWYGMNFVNMPELTWKYGYIAVIAAAAVMVIAEIIYFKKKKLL